MSPVDVVEFGGRAIGLEGSNYHACALLESGAVKCWGDNDTGLVSALGIMLEPNPMPIQMRGSSGPVALLSVGLYHTCTQLSDGRPVCWGMIP